VHDLNKKILDSFPGEEKIYYSADSIPPGEENGEQGELLYYPVEYLNMIQCSGLPLSKLTLKIGCPVMVLRNIDPSLGICNGTTSGKKPIAREVYVARIARIVL